MNFETNHEIMPEEGRDQLRVDFSPEEQSILAMIENNTLREAVMAEIEEKRRWHDLATHDELTGLLNRRGLDERMEEYERRKIRMACLFIDGTNVKSINDKLGHEVGDRAIVGIAEVLKKSTREGDIVARIGGDEFIVIIDLTQRKNERPTSSAVQLHSVEARIKYETSEYLEENPYLIENKFDIAVGGVLHRKGMSLEDMKVKAEWEMAKHKDEQHEKIGQYRQ